MTASSTLVAPVSLAPVSVCLREVGLLPAQVLRLLQAMRVGLGCADDEAQQRLHDRPVA